MKRICPSFPLYILSRANDRCLFSKKNVKTWPHRKIFVRVRNIRKYSKDVLHKLMNLCLCTYTRKFRIKFITIKRWQDIVLTYIWWEQSLLSLQWPSQFPVFTKENGRREKKFYRKCPHNMFSYKLLWHNLNGLYFPNICNSLFFFSLPALPFGCESFHPHCLM